MTRVEMWTYRDTTLSQRNLSGLKVEALDGSIGKVDDATNDVGGSFIVVDTGPWIFGKKVMLPAEWSAGSISTPRRSSSIGRKMRSRMRRSTTKTRKRATTSTASVSE